MSRRADAALALRFTVLKLGRSPAVLVPALLLAALGVRLRFGGSSAAALRVVLPLLPHVLLISTQDLFRGEAAAGAFESVLFVRGGFRPHVLWRSLALVLAGTAYSLAVFLVSGWGRGSLAALSAALAAGIYYVALGGLLGCFLRGGANVLAVIVAQAAAFIGLVADLSGRHGFLEALATGAFATSVDRLKLSALAAVLPNILVGAPLRRFAPWLVPAFAVLFLVMAAAVRRMEAGRR